MIDDHLLLWKYKKNALTMAHVISCDPCRSAVRRHRQKPCGGKDHDNPGKVKESSERRRRDLSLDWFKGKVIGNLHS